MRGIALAIMFSGMIINIAIRKNHDAGMGDMSKTAEAILVIGIGLAAAYCIAIGI